MDHMMERTVHRGMTGVTLRKEVFTDLDFADDVCLLAEMLEVLVLALTVMKEEASTFGLQINWSKTKILQVPSSTCSSINSPGGRWTCWSCRCICVSGMLDWLLWWQQRGVLRRIGLALSCMNMLERRIWKSSIRLETKLHLYQTYIVPVLMYGCETWATTSTCSLASMYLTHGHYARSSGYRIRAPFDT